MYSKNILLAALILFLSVAGCARSADRASPDDKVIAKINTYGLTVADFKDGLKTTISQRFLASDPENAKKDILEELITRKILAQEAQKQNFDKERSFMREIESYWEQTLIKSLLKKKLQEISDMIHVSKKEIEDEYANMKRDVSAEEQAKFPAIEALGQEIRENIIKRKKEILLERWVDDLRKRASVRIDKKALQEIEVR